MRSVLEGAKTPDPVLLFLPLAPRMNALVPEFCSRRPVSLAEEENWMSSTELFLSQAELVASR